MDGIRKIDLLRNLYRAQTAYSNNETVSELRQIKSELKLANDLTVEESPPTNATGSPYLQDQPFQLKNVLYNSPQETEWRDVPSYEQTRENALAFRNLKKLNIL